MKLHKHVDGISQLAVQRRTFRAIRTAYGLNAGQLEVLAAAYSIQTEARPYFTVPALVALLRFQPKAKVYAYVRGLVDRGFLALSLETRSRSSANLYSVTGTGALVLRRYLDTLAANIQDVQRL